MSATASAELLDQTFPRHHALLLRRAPPAAPALPTAAPAPPPRSGLPRHVFAALDLDPRPAVAPPPQPDPLPGLLAEQRAAGYAAGEAAGRAAAATEREEATLAALRLAAAQLADAAPAARAVAEEAASAVAGLMVAMLAAALPSLAARFATAEAASFAELILPVLVDEPSVEMRVSPALAAPLAMRFASQARVAVSADPTLTDGDVSLRWHGGQAERRATEAHAAVAALLSSAGFTTAAARQN